MELTVHEDRLEFIPTGLIFQPGSVDSVFRHKNNQTVGGTLAERRYAALRTETETKYGRRLGENLGEFLYSLKMAGDLFYKRFLNKYGDATYCKFAIRDQLDRKGLYAYVVAGQLRYIGRCRDAFGKRINQGYGQIHPKNCYLDGQATNCHLNSLIAKWQDTVQFFVLPLGDDDVIATLERQLIRTYQPEWNTALRDKIGVA